LLPAGKKLNIKFGCNLTQSTTMPAPFDTELLDRRIGQLWMEAAGHSKGSVEQQRAEKLVAKLLDYLSGQHQVRPVVDIFPDWWPPEANVVERPEHRPIRRKGTRWERAQRNRSQHFTL